jgi:hypothetical protein
MPEGGVMSSKYRLAIVFVTVFVTVWGLFTIAMINEGTPAGQAAMESAILMTLAALGATAFNAAINWAIRGDE